MASIVFLGNFHVDYSSESHHAKSLEALGHSVARLQEAEVDTETILNKAKASDMFVWVHTHLWQTPGGPMSEVLSELKRRKIPCITYHLDLWFGLDRQRDFKNDDFYGQIGHFFATDKLMIDWFNDHTQVKGHYLPAGVFHEEALMLDKSNRQVPEISFVGSRGYHPEWPYRPQLIDWLHTTYGAGFGHYSGEEGTLGLKRGLHLNQLFADTKIVVGDTLCLNFDYPYYWSDRLYETLGRGGFLIMPYVKGMDKDFKDGFHLCYYEFGNFKQLEYWIDYYLKHDTEREKIRQRGHALVKSNHTYLQRWKTILKEVGI